MNNQIIEKILANFCDVGRLISFAPIETGHINTTIKVTCEKDGKEVNHLLQMINTNVFRNHIQLMDNVHAVTSFVKSKVVENGGDCERETLYCKLTNDGKTFCIDDENKVWRLYNYVENSFSYNAIESAEIFFKAGKAFGDFQRLLADFPMDGLYDTIPDFHNTAKRFNNLRISVEKNASGRACQVQKEIDFAFERREETYILVGKQAIGDLPTRVTHNDTKLNNILFDKETNEPVCIVDLDTVMPGLSVYDFGDAIRFGANTASEDEKDLSKVSLDLNLYEQYVRGFLSSAGDSLTAEEVKCLPLGAKMMTFECGMRFLTDFIDGDVYFRTHYPEHNLDRCHTQFALVYDMERKFEQMHEITRKAYKDICQKEY